MIVPPRLANGKPSTRPLKSVLVYFEDSAASGLNNSSTSNGGTTRGAKKATMVCLIYSSCRLVLMDAYT